MALQKQSLNLPFMGLDQKSDPFKVAPGRFLKLQNVIFEKGGPAGILLQKRNGFGALGSLPDNSYSYLTTFMGGLVSIGTSLSAYSNSSESWINKGNLIPIQLNTLPLIRTSSNQAQVDSVIAPNNLVCVVYTNNSPSVTYQYAILDGVTGQAIVNSTVIATPQEPPRVFLLGNYFVIIFSQSNDLKYLSIPINNPTSPNSISNLVTNYAIGALTQPAFDGIVVNNSLYISYNASDGGGAIRMTYLNSFLALQTSSTGVVIASGKKADIISVCYDVTTTDIWTSIYLTSGTTGYVIAVDPQLNSVLTATQIISSGTILNLTSTAINGSITVFYEQSLVYSYGAGLPTNAINSRQCTRTGTLQAATTVSRSVGLASKAFLIGNTSYMLTAYNSAYQPSFFLIGTNANVNQSGFIVAKLAYSNGGGYLTNGLPSISQIGTTFYLGYLIKDLIEAANKSQLPASQTPVFTQTGINMVSFDFTSNNLISDEIGANLHISGGLLWTYDGTQIVEQNFNVWPDNILATWSATGGAMAAQPIAPNNTDVYFYQVTYEWTDNQGNIHRSAPSIAVPVTTTGSLSTGSVTLNIPTLRLTYKTNVKIVIYRWSVLNQTYYQVTSLTSPTFSDPTVDSITYVDTLNDTSIVGNSIIYTTGGVVEDIGPPGTSALTLYGDRNWLVDAEDKNLLWFSKQVIEATPVEFSDLFTIYVAPTLGAQGNTGPISALSAMDDKLIIFKRDAIYYLTGIGPDNTGANSDFSNPIFITSTVGCTNPNSIVFMPQGLMFQSDKGIWLLGRDLSTQYIGAPVENFNNYTVLSATVIPGTNQVRFTLNNNVMLTYDYYFGQWCSFVGNLAISSTLFQNLHTFIDSIGRVFQETPNQYLDGANPVLMSFTTGWFNVADIQGYERIYDLYLLGTYYSPHKLLVQIGYDYNPAPSQQSVISPNNYNAPWGVDSTWGTITPYGGTPQLEQWRVHTQRQTCMAFQLNISEIFDSSYQVPAGAGLTLSNINLRLGVKKSVRPIPAKTTVG